MLRPASVEMLDELAKAVGLDGGNVMSLKIEADVDSVIVVEARLLVEESQVKDMIRILGAIPRESWVEREVKPKEEARVESEKKAAIRAEALAFLIRAGSAKNRYRHGIPAGDIADRMQVPLDDVLVALWDMESKGLAAHDLDQGTWRYTGE